MFGWYCVGVNCYVCVVCVEVVYLCMVVFWVEVGLEFEGVLVVVVGGKMCYVVVYLVFK